MSENQFLKFGIFALLGMCPALSWAQTSTEPPSAFGGLQAVSQRFGPQISDRIVQMEGDLGRSQPRQWHLVVLDPATVRDRSTYEDPHHFSEGVSHVIVNGVPVLRDGEIAKRVAGTDVTDLNRLFDFGGGAP